MTEKSTEIKEMESAVLEWWRALQESPGDRANLRRARNADEVAMQRAYYDLYQKVRSRAPHGGFARRLPYLAGLLAHVQNDSATPLARAMGGSDKPLVSDLRFRRFLKNEALDELYIPMIRIIQMLGRSANIRDLTRSILYWSDRTRRDWAALYYTKEPIDGKEETNSGENE